MGEVIAGVLCILIAVVLVGLHVRTSLARPASRNGNEGLGDIVGTLADKAPHLAGAFAFMVLGLVVLGFLDLDLSAAAG
jgi:hypothetical protein